MGGALPHQFIAGDAQSYGRRAQSTANASLGKRGARKRAGAKNRPISNNGKCWFTVLDCVGQQWKTNTTSVDDTLDLCENLP